VFDDVRILGTKTQPEIHARVHTGKPSQHPRFIRPRKRICRNVWIYFYKDPDSGLIYAASKEVVKFPTRVDYIELDPFTDRVLYFETPGAKRSRKRGA